jgi:DsbC/DsbD-like thiol-disulfide interchange protein
MKHALPRNLWRGLAAASLIASLSSIAIAADISPWDEDMQSAARLIAAQALNTPGGRVFRAGVEIKLKDGWKTYWRYPGDSGVPPVLDFSKSQNVKSVAVLYPAPSRFPDGAGGSSIGYKGDLILPLHVVAEDASRPATLRLKLDYAVCEKLCVPAEAKLELDVTGAEIANESRLAAAEARVPKPAQVGD